jgi:hypothetical protein
VNLTKKELQKIRAKLKSGSQMEIATRTGLGISTVKAALFYPERFNEEVVKTALTLIWEEKERLEALKNLIKEI